MLTSSIQLGTYDGLRAYGNLTTGSNVGFYGYMTDLGGAGLFSYASKSFFASPTLQRIVSLPGSVDLELWFNGVVFNVVGINIWDQTNTKRTYLVASASGGPGGWNWGTGSNPVFTGAGITRRVEFF